MKTVLITGINKGIGKALGDKFLNEGFAVIGTSRDGKSDYSQKNLKVFLLELTDHTSITNCVKDIQSSISQPPYSGKIDILINNAGVLLDDEEKHVIVEKLRQTLEVNLFGTIDFTEQIIPMITENGHIVNMSSQAGSLGDIENFTHSHAPLRYPAYKISKTALNMYTRTLALRLKDENTSIVVSSVHPGWVKTDMGGDEAPVLPTEAAENIYNLAILRPETGQFWFNGNKFPW
ncbi:MAG: SDR family NAD(P)-dependent oxidoreductase [Candidatus Paceibacterota bacterium]|jgi:NAD(P)-dependent dehydrogenase (short-subunit alcohol dehydrogenase family)